MKGLQGGVSETDNSPVARWLRLAAEQASDASELDLDTLIRSNVIQQLDNLRTHDFIAEGLGAVKLQLWGWVYDIGSSEILQLQDSTGEFRALDATA